jgi:hypothetical protein
MYFSWRKFQILFEQPMYNFSLFIPLSKLFFVLPLCFWIDIGLGGFDSEWMVCFELPRCIDFLSLRSTWFYVTPDFFVFGLQE